MGQGASVCGCPTPARALPAPGEGGGDNAHEAQVAKVVPIRGGAFGTVAGPAWAPPNAALVRGAGARVSGQLAGAAGVSWVASRGCAVRLGWSSSEDQLGLRTPPVTMPDVPSLPARVVQVAAGQDHALILALDPSPRVFSCGANDFGQLGLGDTARRPGGPPPVLEVEPLSALALVGGLAAGGHASFAVTQRGDVWSWGRHEESGALGLGDLPVSAVPAPTQVSLLKRRVRAVAAATNGSTSFCLSHLGAVFSWGHGGCGLHGHGHRDDETTPKVLQCFSHNPVVQVSVGLLHALALSASNEVYTWGRVAGVFGQEIQLQTTPKVIDKLKGIRIVQVAAGGEHSLALTEDGDVYGWGAHAGGELCGVPAVKDRPQQYALVHRLELPELGRVRDVACGRCHSLFLASGLDTFQPQEKEKKKEKGSDVWVCGQGAPVPPPKRPKSSVAWNSVPVPDQPTGVALKLTRVDVKRVLEMMATA